MAKPEPHKSKDIPEYTKIAQQAANEVIQGKQPNLTPVKVKNPQATSPVHNKPIK